MAVNYSQLLWLGSTEVVVLVMSLLVLGVDLRVRGQWSLERRQGWMAGLGALGCALGWVWMVLSAPEGVAPGGMLIGEPIGRLVKGAILGLTAAVLGLGSRSRFTEHVGEYVALVLLAATGMLLMVSAGNLLLLFLALELASIPLYALSGFARRDPRSMEAALKYFLFGGMSAAFFLFGVSFVYGATGATEYRAVGAALAAGPGSPGVWVGLAMMLAGLGFKVASAPFHFWAPDVYEGAPLPVAAYVATASKVAAFFAAAKVSVVVAAGAAGSAAWGAWQVGWAPLVAAVAAASMLIGNAGAVVQGNVRRLLAFSAVAHAGYALVAAAGASGAAALASIAFYAMTYAVTTLGVFAVVLVVDREAGGAEFRHYAGLWRRSPWLALGLGVFVLSLAGIPPLAGFFAKFFVFLAALRKGSAGVPVPGLVWLVGLGAATTCVSFYYYLRWLKAVFVEDAGEGVGEGGGRMKVTWIEAVVVGLSVAVVVVAGVFPSTLLGPLERALTAAGY